MASWVYYGDLEEFSDTIYEKYEQRMHDYPNQNQDEWIEAIWNEYNDEGYINWSDHHYDSAWYMYVTEVLGYEPEDVEKYVTH